MSLLRLCALCVWLLPVLGGCAAPQDLPIVTPDSVSGRELLQGVWDVRSPDGELEAILHFDRDQLEATADNSTYRGTWSLAAQDDVFWRLTLEFSDAATNGVNVQLPEGYTESMLLMVMVTGEVVSLEDGGAWTRWQRLSPGGS